METDAVNEKKGISNSHNTSCNVFLC